MATSPAVTVAVLLGARAESLGLRAEVVAGASGLTRPITSPHIQKTGLALAGYDEYLHAGRVLVFGQSEMRFLDRQAPAEREALTERALARGVPCIIATGGSGRPRKSPRRASGSAVPLLVTGGTTGGTIARLTTLLEDSLAERRIVHAVLMDLLGLGVLITGESGIGKSECALDLIMRGHRLVADDTVEVRRRAESVDHRHLAGADAPPHGAARPGPHQRPELFGIAAVRSSKRVELVVQLERWEPGRAYERLGLDDAFDEILAVRIPLVRMPVAPGRGVSTLVEVAARNQLLRSRGHHAARTLARRLDAQLRRASGDTPRRTPAQTTKRRRSDGRTSSGRVRPRRPRASGTGGCGDGSRSRPLRRHHRAVGLRKVAGDPRARGPRVLLRGQPADHADPDARPAVVPAGVRAAKVAIVVDVREGSFLANFPEGVARGRSDCPACTPC